MPLNEMHLRSSAIRYNEVLKKVFFPMFVSEHSVLASPSMQTIQTQLTVMTGD